MEKIYEAEIRSLQEEIATLQEQQKIREREDRLDLGEYLLTSGKSTRDKTDTIRTTGKSAIARTNTIANLKMELEKLEENLARQTEINGIVLMDCKVKTLEKGKNQIIRQHRLSGHCQQLAFQVEFELTEVQDSTPSQRVTGLNVVVDGTEFNEISTFVSRAEEDKSLLLFFRALTGFAESCEHRTRTFVHFKEKYPDVVSLPEGCRAKIMTIQSPQLPGCVATVVWSIDVSSEGTITPKVDLLTKIPEQALSMDQKKVIDDAPRSFQSLQRILGVEASIESIIKAMCME